MHSRNYSNSIQTPISSIFPQLRSLPFFLPLPHIPNFYYPYQSFHFRPFFLPRLLMPSINLFMPPLIRIHSSTPGNEKKLLSNLSIDSIIGSSVDENKTKRESKDIEDVISSIFTGPSHPSLSDYLPLQMLLYSYHLALKNSDNNKKGNALIKDDISANTNIKTEKVLKDLSKVMLVQSKKGKKPRASFEPTNEENAQIQASEASSSNFIDKSRGYACHRCGKLFSYAYYLDKHLKFTPCVDNGQRRFPCPHLHCLRSFEKQSRLRIHILHVHERRRPHICQLCGKAFSQSSSLSKHMRTHSGERPYKCPHCDKSFTASSILRTHIRQHSGEKPFKCTICGKQFASHAAHDSHMRRSHQK